MSVSTDSISKYFVFCTTQWESLRVWRGQVIFLSMKFGIDMYDLKRMNSSAFGSPMAFPFAPPSGQNFHFCTEKLQSNGQIAIKLPENSQASQRMNSCHVGHHIGAFTQWSCHHRGLSKKMQWSSS